MINSRKLLLVCCSSNKNRFFETLPARDMYGGTLTLGGIRYAEENDLDCLILSAKYGFITPDTIITRYNQRFSKSKPFRGEFPKGEGFYLGGPTYFGNAPPERFKPLFPELPIGKLLQALKQKLRDPKLNYVPRVQKVYGKTWYLYRWLLEAKLTGGISMEEAFVKLCIQFGEDPKMMQTVKTQFRQKRIGDERGCTLFKSGNKFWLEPNTGINLL